MSLNAGRMQHYDYICCFASLIFSHPKEAVPLSESSNRLGLSDAALSKLTILKPKQKTNALSEALVLLFG